MKNSDAKHQIKDLKTEWGNEVLADLLKCGWKVKSEYSALMFDKGIDFDSYDLVFESSRLRFEWDNWMEWQIEGDEAAIAEVARRLSILEGAAERED